MTLRLTESETTALRDFAADHGRSMQDVAREAIMVFINDEEHEAAVGQAIDDLLDRYPDTLRRLGL